MTNKEKLEKQDVYDLLVTINAAMTGDNFLIPTIFCVLDALVGEEVSGKKGKCEYDCESCIHRYLEEVEEGENNDNE